MRQRIGNRLRDHASPLLAPSLQLLTAVVLFAEPFVLQQGVGFGLIWIALAIYAFDGLSRHRRVAPVAVQCAEAVAPVKDAAARVE